MAQQAQQNDSRPQAMGKDPKPVDQNKKKGFPWLGILLLVGAAATTIGIMAACKSPSATEPPKPPLEEKRYTIKAEYIRINLTRLDLLWKVVSTTIAEKNTGGWLAGGQMVKKDDYHLEKEFSGILETESYGNLYYIYAIDPARWNETDDTVVVGDRFILTVLETGSTLELTNIIQNNLENNPYKGPNAKMAVWGLKRNGVLTRGN
jgi:hypothetical protein